MARMRRLLAVAGACVVAGAFVTSPAGADQPEVYVGSASSTALDLGVGANKATLGVSTAKVTSQGTALAEGAGQLVPQLTNFAGNQKAEVTGSGSSVKPEKCATPELPAQLAAILSIGAACSAVEASVVNGLPKALAEGSVAQVDLSGDTILSQLDALPIGDTLAQLLDPVCAALTATCPVTTTVQDLVTSVLSTKTAEITVGKATSSVVTEAGKVTSSARAAGAEIKLLPLPSVNGLPSTEPVATIIVGEAKATAIYDRGTGTSTPSWDPALVRVRLNTVATGVQEITVPVNQTVTILAGTPLESTITVADGRKVTNPDGTVGAVADGVRLELLKGLPTGAVVLGLAHAEAGVAGTPAVITPAVPLEAPRGELPRTGGTPWIPMAGAGVLAAALAGRRALSKAGR